MATISPPPPGSTAISPPPPGSTAIGEAPSENEQVTSPASAFGPALVTAAEAAPQGALFDIPEAVYQWGEKLFGLPSPGPGPGGVFDKLREYRDWSGSTGPGQVGRAVGNVGGFVGGGELLDALGVGARLPGWLTEWAARNPRLATTLKTAGQSTVAQPTQSNGLGDFLEQKGMDAGLGAILGHILGRPIQRAAHETATEANRAAQETHAATREADSQANEIAAKAAKEGTAEDEENRLHANEIATREARKGTAADIRATRAMNAAAKKAVEDKNAAALAAHTQTVATEKEQHAALTEAQQAFHTGEREKAQAAASELSRRKQAALDARDAQRTAKLDVPAQTTAGWWQRTGARIGEDVPTGAKADTGAHVQKAVAGRLNSLTDRMNLDPADASLSEELKEITRTTRMGLQERNQTNFFNQQEATPLERIVLDAKGQPQPRTAEAPQPPPTGRFADLVLNPLKRGVLTGRKLTEYLTSLGNEANTLATRARESGPGTAEQADLLAQASAYRRVQDTVIGHAAGGNAEDKLALEQARQAYMMWGVGNDAAKASRGGVGTPSQMIDMMVKRLGEARYKQALIDPKSPFHDELNWLQGQRDAHAVQIPRDRDVTRPLGEAPPIPGTRPSAIPAPSTRRPPTEIPLPEPAEPPEARQPRILGPEAPRQPHVIPEEPPPVDRHVPAKPGYRERHIARGAGQLAGGAALGTLTPHTYIATGLGISGLRDLLGRAGGEEPSLEAWLRRRLTGRPRVQRAVTAAGGAAGGQEKRIQQGAEKIPQAATDALRWAWGSRQ